MTTSPAVRVANEVRVALTRLHMSQAALAEQIGMPKSALSRRLTGEKPFDINEITKVADVLGVPLDQLVADRIVSDPPASVGARS